ncbi:hypothetical protein D3C80_1152470 [compost metagenome]
MLPNQLAPFELIYLDQRGDAIAVECNERRLTFDTFNLLVEHLKTHPDFDVKDYSKLAVTFELVENTTTELIGSMAYKRSVGEAHIKVTTFKVKGPLPDLSTSGWLIDFTV